MSESLKMHFHTPGDSDAGIFSHSETIDLGVVPEDVGEDLRTHLRKSLKDTLRWLYDDRVTVTFSDEEPRPVRSSDD